MDPWNLFLIAMVLVGSLLIAGGLCRERKDGLRFILLAVGIFIVVSAVRLSIWTVGDDLRSIVNTNVGEKRN